MSEAVATLDIEVKTTDAIAAVGALNAALTDLSKHQINVPTAQLKQIEDATKGAERGVKGVTQAFSIAAANGGRISFGKALKDVSGEAVESMATLNSQMSLAAKNAQFLGASIESRLKVARKIREALNVPLPSGVSGIERDTQLILQYGNAALDAAKNFDKLIGERDRFNQSKGDQLNYEGTFRSQQLKLREEQRRQREEDRAAQKAAAAQAAGDQLNYEGTFRSRQLKLREEQRRQREEDRAAQKAAAAQAAGDQLNYEGTFRSRQLKLREEQRRQREEDRAAQKAAAAQAAGAQLDREGLFSSAARNNAISRADFRFNRGDSLRDAERRLRIAEEISAILAGKTGDIREAALSDAIKKSGRAAVEASKDIPTLKAEVDRLRKAEDESASATKAATKARTDKTKADNDAVRAANNLERAQRLNDDFNVASPKRQLSLARASQQSQQARIDAGATPDEARAASVKRYGEAVTRASADVPALERHVKQLGVSTDSAARSQHAWNLAAHEGHSLARGFAGTLGNLWLTYGSIVPLLAGAALGAGFREAAKQGGEFAYQLTFVKALSNESAESVARLSDAAKTLGANSLFGPGEIASGFRILAQAGIKAKDSVAAMLPTLDLATVGEMKMEDAATTLVGVMNAFNMTTSDLGHIGDVFAKAAAESQTSVEGIANAMKYASVVGEQYSAKLEDTATALTLLAKLNITGTSAGTAFRNMLKELYSPTKQAGDVMKRLGIETKDAAGGGLRPFVDIVFDLQGKLSQFNKSSQVKILQSIFGERGAKEAIAILSQTREEWDALNKTIGQSSGFMREVSQELEATAKGSFKQAIGTLQAQFVSVFESLAPQMTALTYSLKSAFSSPEFKGGLTSAVKLVGSLADALISLIGPASKALSIFVELGPVLIGLGVASGVAGVIGKVALALTEAGGAAVLLGRGLAGLTAPGRVIGLIVGGLTAAYLTLKRDTPEAVKSANNLTSAIETQVAKLKLENEELDKQIRLREENLTLDQLEARSRSDLRKVSRAETVAKISSLEYQISDFESEMKAGKGNFFNPKLLNPVLTYRNKQNVESVKELKQTLAAQDAVIAEAEKLQIAKNLKTARRNFYSINDEQNRRSATGVGTQDADSVLGSSIGKTAPKSFIEKAREMFARDRIAADRLRNDLTKADAQMMEIIAGRQLVNDKTFSKLSDKEKNQVFDQYDAANAAERAARANTFLGESLKNLNGIRESAIETVEGLTKSQAALNKIERDENFATLSEGAKNRIRDIGALGDAFEKYEKIRADEAASIKESLSDADKEEDRTQQRVKSLKEEIELMGLSIDQREKMHLQLLEQRSEQLKIDADLNALQSDRVLNDGGDSLTAGQLARLAARQRAAAETQDQEVALTKQRAEKKLALEKDWIGGAKKAFEDYATSVRNEHDSMFSIISNGLKGLEDAFVQFATTGKLSIKDLVATALVELARMQIRKSVMGPISEFIGNMFPGSSGSSAYSDSSNVSVIADVAKWAFSAKGNVFGATQFANGGVFTNKLFNKPTMFTHGGGFGVMGEAGPEAVMPLQRDSQGRLGVISAGGSGSGPVSIVNNITISKDGASSTSTASDSAGIGLAKQIDAAIMQVLYRERRPGGVLYA